MEDEPISVSLHLFKEHLESILGPATAETADLAAASALLDVSRCIVLVLDTQRRIVFVNNFFEELTGFSLAEIESADWFETFIRPVDRERVGQRFAEATGGGEATRGNINPILTKSGARLIEWYDRVLRVEDGQVVGLLAIGHDITERQLALEQLREVNQRLERLVEERTAALGDANRVLEATLDTSVVCLAYLDADFNFVRVNRAYAGAAGYEPAFLEGQNHFELFPDAENEAIFRRVRDSGEPFSVEAKPFEYEDQPERGVTHWDWTLVPIFGAHGEVSGLVLTLQDVTERVRMLETARAREAELRVKEAAIQTALNGIAFADLQGSVTYVNESFLDLWLLEHESAAVGRQLSEFWTDPEAASAIMATLLEDGLWFGRLEARRADGVPAMMQVSAHLVSDGETLVGVMASFVDVTPEVNAALGLARRLDEKEVLLREIHHRVKNNLQVISSLLYLQSTGGPEEVAELFKDSRDRVAAMALVHETLYRSDDLNHVDFASYLERLVGAIGASQSARTRFITLDVHVDCAEVSIEKAVPCGLIVNEWVTNALKHAFPERSGTVRVSARSLGDDTVQLQVSDDGTGIHHDLQTTGVGLKLVVALAEQLAGKVEHRTGADGTTFSVVFAR